MLFAFRAGAAALLAILLLPARVGAAELYVASDGDDGDDGLTPATAWATLTHAAEQVGPGDTVHVAPGAYGGFYLDTSGTPGNPIAFVADGPGVEIVADNPVTPDGINVEAADHVVIDGFTVLDRTRAGIRAVLSDFVTIRNCTAGDNGVWGIFTGFTDDLTVENNETYGSVDEHGIYVSNSSDRPVIRGNLIHDNSANGIHLNGDASQGGDGLIEQALIEANVIWGNGTAGGSGINGDGLVDSTIRNNLLYDNHASGVSLYRIDASAGATGNLVVNNTIVNASDGRWCININSGSTNNTLLNNLLYNHHPWRGVISVDASSRPGLVSDFNGLMDRLSIDGGNTVIDLSDWQAEGYGASSFLAAPADLFVTPGVDFHLLVAAPAVDAGTATGAPAEDLDGNPRPVGAAHDVGAYEAQLLACGDGDADPGEECGEPGLSCADPCTTCQQCVCTLDEPVCGDALLCPGEQCEDDGDCTPGQACQSCACANPFACQSGIVVSKPRLKMRALPLKLRLKGEAVVPKPWTGIDPPAGGIRVVVDHAMGEGGIDIVIPGGPLWSTSGGGTKWTYRDPTAGVGGIRKVVLMDRSAKEDGEIRWVVAGKGGAATVPDDDAVRIAIVLGGPLECAGVEPNGPAGERPHCHGDSQGLSCH